MADDRPDYYMSTVIKGFDDPDYVSLACDEHGNLQALLRGSFGGLIRTIAVDNDGVMRANLVAQELTRSITRINQGGALVETFDQTWNTIPALTLFTIEGTGIIYDGWIYVTGGGAHENDTLVLVIDGSEICAATIKSLYEWDITTSGPGALYLIKYDTIFKNFVIGIRGGVTFESAVYLTHKNSQVALFATARGNLLYALYE